MSEIELYKQPWTVSRPGLIVILVEQSSAMAALSGPTLSWAGQRLADAAARLANSLLNDVVARCTIGGSVLPVAGVAVLGYGVGGTVKNGLSSSFTSNVLVSIADLAAHPLRTERIIATEYNSNTDTLNHVFVEVPLWMEPEVGTSSPMCAALELAHRVVKHWIESHLDSLPPLILNIASGQSTDGNPGPIALRIAQLATRHGAALVFNCHLSSDGVTSLRYPLYADQVPPSFSSRALFYMSSGIPQAFIEAARSTGIYLEPGARGFTLNADMADLIQIPGIDGSDVTGSGTREAAWLAPANGLYEGRWAADRPGCLIVLVDQSGAMRDLMAEGLFGAGRPKAYAAAEIVNELLWNTQLRCQSGTMILPRVELSVIGYGLAGTVCTALSGALTDADVVPITELSANPARIEHAMKTEYDPETGSVFQVPVDRPIWVEPSFDESGSVCPMVLALQAANNIAHAWSMSHPSSFPPIVVNITSGTATDGHPLPYIQQLAQVTTKDGAALVFNCLLSGASGFPIRFPDHISQLPMSNVLARQFFEMSSILPETMVSSANATYGMGLRPGARASFFGTGVSDILQMMTIASLAKPDSSLR